MHKYAKLGWHLKTRTWTNKRGELCARTRTIEVRQKDVNKRAQAKAQKGYRVWIGDIMMLGGTPFAIDMCTGKELEKRIRCPNGKQFKGKLRY